MSIRKHLTGIIFTGLGTLIIGIHFFTPQPSNVVSYTDQYLWNLPIAAGAFLIFIGWMIDMMENMF